MTERDHLLPRNRVTGAFERRVAQALDVCVAREAPVVVACSGGPDSTAALVAVARARASGAGGPVVAACFDHRMRPPPETEADRAFVERLGACLSVPVHAGSAGRDLASESEAREARYRWLAGVCADVAAAVCVTGHTLDDQAETVLLRLARGTGLAGASAMAPLAPWPVSLEPAALARGGELAVARPLLAIERAEVERYLRALRIEPRRDPSNETLTYARNRVRHEVLPGLHEVNERASRHLAAFAARAREDEAALDAWAREAFARLARCDADEVQLERSGLRELPPAVASRVLRIAVERAGGTAEADQLASLLRAARRHGAQVDLAGCVARSDGGTLAFRRRHG